MIIRQIHEIRRLTAQVANPHPDRRSDNWFARVSWPEGSVVIIWRVRDAIEMGGRAYVQDNLVVTPLGSPHPSFRAGGLDPNTFTDDNTDVLVYNDLTHEEVARLARSYFWDNANALVERLLDAGAISPLTLLAIAAMPDDVTEAASPGEQADMPSCPACGAETSASAEHCGDAQCEDALA